MSTGNDESRAAEHSGAGMNPVSATGVFVLTFWAWNLIGPLSPTYAERLDLGPTQTAVLAAFPVLVGAAGGLGGYFPPLITGAVFQLTGAYTIGLLLLATTALGVALFAVRTFRARTGVGD